jgi:hypothetical protein
VIKRLKDMQMLIRNFTLEKGDRISVEWEE